MAQVIMNPAKFERGQSLSAAPSRHCRPYTINLGEPAAILHWCRHFDTTAELLLDAVKRVGTNPAIVRLQLRKS
jgi:hypothetical protein